MRCWSQRDALGYAGYGREVDGVAEIEIEKAGPFVNNDDFSKIEKNIEKLTDFFLSLAKEVKPNSLKMFTNEESFSFPFNSFFSYYDGYSDLVDDVSLIKSFFERTGNKNLPYIDHYSDKEHAYLFHEWLSSENRRSTYQHFLEASKNQSIPDEDYVKKILSSGRFDIYEGEEGFAILNYPNIFEKVLNNFYLELFQ